MNIKHRHLKSIKATDGVRREIKELIHPRTLKISGYYVKFKNGVCVAYGNRPKLINDLLAIVEAIQDFARKSKRRIPTDFNFITIARTS